MVNVPVSDLKGPVGVFTYINVYGTRVWILRQLMQSIESLCPSLFRTPHVSYNSVYKGTKKVEMPSQLYKKETKVDGPCVYLRHYRQSLPLY